jgi:hypothetical protein
MSLERLAMSQYRFDLYTNHEGLQHVIGLPKGFDLAPDETGRFDWASNRGQDDDD